MFPAIANPGQHLFVGLSGDELTPATRQLLATVQPGGMVLFARNVENAGQLRALIHSVQRAVPVRPIIAIDQECRHVNRLHAIVGGLPAIDEVKAADDAQAFGRAVGRSLRELGIDMDFAPVLDLERFDAQTDNALRARCWGQTAAEVIRWAGDFIIGLEHEGVAACPKHFPGLGSSTQDSHEHLPTVLRRRAQLLAEDVQPYAQLASQLSAVMVGHGHYVAFDGPTPTPASRSPLIIGELLRRQLGFTGLVVTDDMEMGAITRSGNFVEAVTGAIQAGADMVLVCHTPEKILAAHEALAKAKIPAESRSRLERFRKKWIGRKS